MKIDFVLVFNLYLTSVAINFEARTFERRKHRIEAFSAKGYNLCNYLLCI